MPGQPAHFEIPADDTAKARQFWGSLFDWQFEAMPGPFEYHMTRISDQAGLAVTNGRQRFRGTAGRWPCSSSSWDDASSRIRLWSRRSRREFGAPGRASRHR